MSSFPFFFLSLLLPSASNYFVSTKSDQKGKKFDDRIKEIERLLEG